MSEAEYTKLAGHLFEVVPTQGNGHIGFLKQCENRPDLYEVVDDLGKCRYFKAKANRNGTYVEVTGLIEVVSDTKIA